MSGYEGYILKSRHCASIGTATHNMVRRQRRTRDILLIAHTSGHHIPLAHPPQHINPSALNSPLPTAHEVATTHVNGTISQSLGEMFRTDMHKNKNKTKKKKKKLTDAP